MECSCQLDLNLEDFHPIKVHEQARSNIPLVWVPHEKKLGPVTVINGCWKVQRIKSRALKT